jgi:hypothetical protein
MRRRAALLAVLPAVMIVPGCHASANPPPSTPPSTPPPTTTARLTQQQARCVAEATFLIRVADMIVRVVPAQESTPGNEGMRAALDTLQAQKTAMANRTFHPPFDTQSGRLADAADEMIAGYEGLLAPGHHDHAEVRALNRQIAEGAAIAATTQANLRNQRSACVP